MKTTIQYLAVEVTRRCNMECAHCLRGKSQNVDMSKEVADAVLKGLDGLGSICFSGGEPTLNVPILKHFSQKLENMSYGGFFIATNGKTYDREFIPVVLDLYANAEDEDACALSISMDEFHSEFMSKDSMHIETRYKALSFFSDSKNFLNTPNRKLIKRGMAEENGLGISRMPEVLDSKDFDSYGNGTVCIDNKTIYVNVFGDVYSDCDLSYEMQDDKDEEYYLGNVLEEDGLTNLMNKLMAKYQLVNA